MSVAIDYTSGAFAATKAQSVGTITGSDVDLSSGQYFEYTPAADTTFTFSNAPASGTAAGFALAVTGADVASGYDLANASYDSVSFSVAGQDTAPRKVFFKPDGTKMYVAGSTGRNVYEYDLSPAWDITSATFLQSFSVSTEETDVRGLHFKPDGTEMYIIGSGDDDVNQYSLSTAWDVSTASFLQAFSVASQETSPQGLFFKPDGTQMFVVGIIGDSVYEYALSTAWDVSTSSYTQSFSVISQAPFVTGIVFNPDGDKMWVIGQTSDAVSQYSLSTAWDVSTASYDSIAFSVASQEASPQGFFFKTDGSKMYVVGTTNDTIYQYSTAAAAPAEWTDPDLANASYDSVSFSVAGQETNAQDISFGPDGSKMYVLGAGGRDVNEYNLSTAWDVSSASYVQNFSVFGQESNPQGLFLGPDGTKMYVTGSTGDDVNEYTLSTAWDVSSASYVQNFSVSAQEAFPTAIWFKPDGAKMYVLGAASDSVNEYDLTTAWNVSTASYSQNFSVASQDAIPQGLFFSPDGTQIFVAGNGGDAIYEYNLSTAWDVSTASYTQNFSVSTQDTTPLGVFFKSDGSKMYVVGNSNSTIYQYSTD